jgi:hypothetical protein
MRNVLLAGLMIAATAVASAMAWSKQNKKEIVGLRPEEVKWFTPPYYNDGRQRAQLLGDSTQGGTWIDRVSRTLLGCLSKYFYEHQSPLASVAWLIGLHLPGPGLPVVPHSLQM